MAISIMISPAKVVQAGARWRVQGRGAQEGPWLDAGAVRRDLEPCDYRIAFAPVIGWREPRALVVRNVKGFDNAKTAVYTPLSWYAIGQIPPLTAWHGQPLEFMLAHDEVGAVDIRSNPQPAGELSLDPSSGRFRYTPAPEDKLPFQITLAHRDGAAQQTFAITPMAILRPEVDVFGDTPRPQSADLGPLPVTRAAVVLSDIAPSDAKKPPPPATPISAEAPLVPSVFLEAPLFPVLPDRAPVMLSRAAPKSTGAPAAADEDAPPVMDIEANAPEGFNHAERTTQNIRIIGETVILEKGRETYDAIHANPAIKRLDIFAEAVTIRSPLHVPQATVRIHARELRFEDQADVSSFLSTTPVDHPTGAQPATRDEGTHQITPAADGQPGARAGDVRLRLESYSAPDPSPKRFILVGGRGQNPGAGLDGRPGSTMAAKATYYQANPGGTYKIVYGVHYSKGSGFVKTKSHPWGAPPAWPTDGEDGTPAGMPGPGGSGGTLTTTLDLASQTDTAGGPCGQPGRTYNGGAPGRPRYAVMVESWDKHEEPFGGHHWGWRYLSHAGFNRHSKFTDGQDFWAYVTKPGSPVRSPAGRKGGPGKVVPTGHPLAWLDPLLLHEILERAKRRYLCGDQDGARAKIARYAELLDIYARMEAWKALDDATQLELGRIRNEMGGLLARLDSHLDYFGNPAGWVPLMSFEVNRTIFDNEIDRAVEILYLSYWLGEKAQDDQRRIEALKQIEVKLKQEIEAHKEQYAQATNAIAELDVQASEITNAINLTQEKLRNLEEELRQKAEAQLEEPWWRTGLKIAGTLCSVVPVFQPALGAVGGLMNLGADFDKDDPWKTITGTADIATAYSDARVGQKKAAFELVAKKVDTQSKTFQALQSAKGLQDATHALASGLEGVARVMAERQAPKSAVDALLRKLEAESDEFKQLSGELAKLLEKKMDFMQKLSEALQTVAEIPNAITTNLLAIDSAQRAITKGQNVLHDGRLAMHLSAMARRAKERLLKYHYYLAKSYEYRLLQRYQGHLDLNRMFEEMARLATLNLEADEPHRLSKAQFASLKGIYQEMLATVAEEIFEVYQARPPELSAPRRFSLTANEVARLNAGDTVTLNLMDLELFDLEEENIRIVDIEVENPQITIEGAGERALAEFDFRFEHAGVSQLRQNGRTIRFYHFAGDALRPIVWGARYDAVDKIITPIKPSAASDSLLRSLLKSDTAGSLMLYSRPAAWADIAVRRDVKVDRGITARIEALRIKVSYDFTPQFAGVRVVHVQTAPVTDNLNPYFILDQADLTGRRDGRGNFYRAYRGLPVKVAIVAQDRYGQWIFDHWADQDGNALGKHPRLQRDVSADQILRAVYRPAKPK